MPIPVAGALAAWKVAQALAAAGAIYWSKQSIEEDLDTNWGGTSWLEGNNVAAHDMYLSRLDSWSDAFQASGGEFRTWSAADKRQARTSAQWLFQSSTTATQYWEGVANFWSTTAPAQMLSVSPDQLQKIQLATGASVTASIGYDEARELASDGFKLTWKGYAAIAAVAALILYRR